jgi:hypothetical protein
MAGRVFIWIGSVLMAGYVLFSVRLYSRQQNELQVQRVCIKVKDSVDHPYVTSKEIGRLLKENQLQVIDKKLIEVDLSRIERVIDNHSMVKSRMLSFAFRLLVY